MITLFSIPKPFTGHIGIIQANAISSWARLPGCNVILFGDEEGLAEAAAASGAMHIRKLSRNDWGTPLVGEAFEQARQRAVTPLLAYVNTDIILTSEFVRAAQIISESGLKSWLAVGQRHDIDVREPLDFGPGWEARLTTAVRRHGVLHGKAGLDYFLFPRTFSVSLPPFAVGRPGWDSWLIYKTRSLGIPLIDGTNAIMAIHQNHPPAYKPYGIEAQKNVHWAGGFVRMGTIRDANWRLTQEAVLRYPLAPRFARALLFSWPVRFLLSIKRAMWARWNREN